MTADRMERVRETIKSFDRGNDVNEWPDDEAAAYRDNGGFGNGREAAEDVRLGKLTSALYDTFCTLTDAEWEQTREDVDRAVWDGELPMADAAMRAVGLRREGE